MEASETQVRFIAEEIFRSEKPVTYHTLSRGLNLHVNAAKHILTEFYKNNETSLAASWIITGIKNDKLRIKLVGNEDLAESIKLFSKVNTVHIYCVYLNKLNLSTFDISLHELNFPLKTSEIENSYNNGMIKGPEIVKVVHELVRAPIPNKSPQKQRQNQQESKPKTIKSASLSSGYVSRKSEKKAEPVTTKLPTATSNSGYVYKSRKVQEKQPKERVIISNEDEVMEDVQTTKANQEKKSQTISELEKMFDSDFSDDDNDKTEKGDKEETPIDIDMEDVENQPQEPTVEPVPEPEPVIEQAEPTPEPETVQTVDEDGYITTARKKVAPRPEVKRTIKQRPTLTPKKDGKKKQASLMNFFGKK